MKRTVVRGLVALVALATTAALLPVVRADAGSNSAFMRDTGCTSKYSDDKKAD
jgi:hypothetical protein